MKSLITIWLIILFIVLGCNCIVQGAALLPVRATPWTTSTNPTNVRISLGLYSAAESDSYLLSSTNLLWIQFITSLNAASNALAVSLGAASNSIVQAEITNAVQQTALAGLTNRAVFTETTNAGSVANITSISNRVGIVENVNGAQDAALAGLTNSLATKQNGTLYLSNLNAWAISNIISANANITLATNNGVLTITGVATNFDATGLTARLNQADVTNVVQQTALFGLTNMFTLTDSTNASQQTALIGLTNRIITTSNSLYVIKLNATNGTAYTPALIGGSMTAGSLVNSWIVNGYVGLDNLGSRAPVTVGGLNLNYYTVDSGESADVTGLGAEKTGSKIKFIAAIPTNGGGFFFSDSIGGPSMIFRYGTNSTNTLYGTSTNDYNLLNYAMMKQIFIKTTDLNTNYIATTNGMSRNLTNLGLAYSDQLVVTNLVIGTNTTSDASRPPAVTVLTVNGNIDTKRNIFVGTSAGGGTAAVYTYACCGNVYIATSTDPSGTIPLGTLTHRRTDTDDLHALRMGGFTYEPGKAIQFTKTNGFLYLTSGDSTYANSTNRFSIHQVNSRGVTVTNSATENVSITNGVVNTTKALIVGTNTSSVVASNGNINASGNITASSATIWGNSLASSSYVDAQRYTSFNMGAGRGGNITMNVAEIGVVQMTDVNVTNFNRLAFGLINSNFPALKRNAASLEVTDAVGNSRATNNFIVPGVVISTNGFILPASTPFTAPASLSGQGGHLWSDGTNLSVVIQNSASTRTTNNIITSLGTNYIATTNGMSRNLTNLGSAYSDQLVVTNLIVGTNTTSDASRPPSLIVLTVNGNIDTRRNIYVGSMSGGAGGAVHTYQCCGNVYVTAATDEYMPMGTIRFASTYNSDMHAIKMGNFYSEPGKAIQFTKTNGFLYLTSGDSTYANSTNRFSIHQVNSRGVTVTNSSTENVSITNGVVNVTKGVILAASTNSSTAPNSLGIQGAHLWSDGTNLSVVLQNSASTRTTNNIITTDLVTILVATNSSQSNIVINFNQPAVEIFATNNLSFTNYSGIVAGMGVGRDSTAKNVRIHIIPQLIDRTVIWPTLGVPANGVQWKTNANSNMGWTTLTNGSEYVLSLSSRGTNIFATITEWK